MKNQNLFYSESIKTEHSELGECIHVGDRELLHKNISPKYFNTESFCNGKSLLLMIFKLAEVPACDELFAQFAYLLLYLQSSLQYTACQNDSESVSFPPHA